MTRVIDREEGTMEDLRIFTTTGTDTVLDEALVQGFKTSMRGPLFRPGDAGYDEARTVWNGMIDRKPALIARCAGVADVIQAVNFARTHHLLVSVRGGGHNVTGTAVCNGGLMIDLSQMRSVRVDPSRRTVRAEGGTKWIDFDHETQAFGLATTGAHVPIPVLPDSPWVEASAGWEASTAWLPITLSLSIS
jgi:hypothetical protein